jgi:hypothetical protein
VEKTVHQYVPSDRRVNSSKSFQYETKESEPVTILICSMKISTDS